MPWQIGRRVLTKQPTGALRVRPEFAKDIDFLWVPGMPEWRTKQPAQLQGSAAITAGPQGKVLRSAIQSYTGNGAAFSGQAVNGTDATIIVAVSRFMGNDGVANTGLCGALNTRGLIVRYTGEVAFMSNAFHDSGVFLSADSKTVIGAVFGESYGTDFYFDGKDGATISASGLYSWSYETLGWVAGGASGGSVGIDTALAVVFRKRLSAPLMRKLTANPWQIFEPEPMPWFIPSGSAPQLLAPTGEISGSTWIASNGGTTYSCVDEATADGADYAYTLTPGAWVEWSFETPDTGHNGSASGGYARYQLPAGTGSITVTLRQGSTVLETYGPHTLTGSVQDFAQLIAATTSDSTDLRLRFTAS